MRSKSCDGGAALSLARLVAPVALIVAGGVACSTPGASAPGVDGTAQPEVVVSPSAIGGPSGMRIGPEGGLYVGAVVSQKLYRVDLATGAVTTIASGIDAGADDLVFLPDGTMVWTAILEGKVMARDPAGMVRVIAESLPGVDGIAYRPGDGRLFVSQCFLADALLEIDITGRTPPKKLLGDLGCLNGFDIGPDGAIYGPSWFGGTILRIDPDSRKVATVVSGLSTPAAVKFGPDGNLYAVNAGDGRVLAIDVKSGATRDVVQLGSGLDNLLPLGRDRLLVSSLADKSIISVDLASGDVSTLAAGKFMAPAGLAIGSVAGEERLYVADIATLNYVALPDRKVHEVGRDHASPGALIVSSGMVSVGRSYIMLSSFSGDVQWIDRKTLEVLGKVSGLASPFGLAELEDGTIAVAEYGAGRIGRIDPATQAVLPPIAVGFQGPTGLALAPDGNLLVSEHSGGRVARVDVATGRVEHIALGLTAPEGIALTPDGDLVVADPGSKRLLLVDTAGTRQTRVLAADLPIGLPAQKHWMGPVFVPTGVAVSTNSDIYFSSDVDHAIYRVPMRGRAGEQ